MKKYGQTVLRIAPLLLGLLSVLSLCIYWYAVNHAPYRFEEAVVLGPVFSFAGLIIALFTAKNRKTHPVLWTWGLVICAVTLILFLLFLLLLFLIARAIFG